MPERPQFVSKKVHDDRKTDSGYLTNFRPDTCEEGASFQNEQIDHQGAKVYYQKTE
jgi:hypothetical protein